MARSPSHSIPGFLPLCKMEQHLAKTAEPRSDSLHSTLPKLRHPSTCAAHSDPARPGTFEEGPPARDSAGSACRGLPGPLGQAHWARRPCPAHRGPQLHQGQVVVEGPRVKLGRGQWRKVNGVWRGMLFLALRAWGLPSHLGVGQDAVHGDLLRLLTPGTLGQCHRPQKLVRGAAGRMASDTQDKDAARSPGDPALRPRASPSEPAAGVFFGLGAGGAGRGEAAARMRTARHPPKIRAVARPRGCPQAASWGGGRRQGAAKTGPLASRRPDDPGRVGSCVGDPGWAGAWGRTYPAKQCAAVSTQDAATRTPPHRGCPPSSSLTSQGQAPGGAALPPTMRPWARVTLTVPGGLSPHGPGKAEAASRGTSPGRPHHRGLSRVHPALSPAPWGLSSLTWLRWILEEGALRPGAPRSC